MWMILLVAVIGASAAVLAAGVGVAMILAFTIVLLLVVGWLFGSLTVAIAGGAINWWFGPGFWKKGVTIYEIEACEPVRNRWWWGWGIRYYGKGWLYNVSGLDAVELTLKDGKHIRIGTDEPEALVMAIRNHRDELTDVQFQP